METAVSGKQFPIGDPLCGHIETLIRRATENWQPVVIADTTTRIPPVRVEPAVMHLELTDASVLIVRDAALGDFNVVFSRPDDSLGWINPNAPKKG
jgi:hypothetical protein